MYLFVQNGIPPRSTSPPESVSTGLWCVQGFGMGFVSNHQNCRNKQKILENETLFLRGTVVYTKSGHQTKWQNLVQKSYLDIKKVGQNSTHESYWIQEKSSICCVGLVNAHGTLNHAATRQKVAKFSRREGLKEIVYFFRGGAGGSLVQECPNLPGCARILPFSSECWGRFCHVMHCSASIRSMVSAGVWLGGLGMHSQSSGPLKARFHETMFITAAFQSLEVIPTYTHPFPLFPGRSLIRLTF